MDGLAYLCFGWDIGSLLQDFRISLFYWESSLVNVSL